jgi:hypothetical protein
VTAREIGRVTIAEALELTALVARKQPDRYGRGGIIPDSQLQALVAYIKTLKTG